MLFNDFDKDETCEHGKRLIDLAEGRQTCIPCRNQVERRLAEATVFGHLGSALYCLWSFDFIGMFVELVWSIQRLAHTGDYGPGGHFTKILKTRASSEEADS